MNTDEKWAWIRFGWTASIFAYLFWKLFLIDWPLDITVWQEASDGLSNLFIGFSLAGLVWTELGKGAVEEDERDRAISASANKAALIALTVIIMMSTKILDWDTSADLLTTYPAAWFGHYLIACLALAWAIQSSVCVFLHWRDRR